QGRSASRSASDRRGAIEVLPENAVFGRLAGRRPEHAVAASCIGRARPHHRDSHRGRRRFSGQTRGGRYSWARYYHPGLQRFVSEDPIGFAGGDVNLYSYVANRPTFATDPTGEVFSPAPGSPCAPPVGGRKSSFLDQVSCALAIMPTPAGLTSAAVRTGAAAAAIRYGPINPGPLPAAIRSEEHTSELQSRF